MAVRGLKVYSTSLMRHIKISIEYRNAPSSKQDVNDLKSKNLFCQGY